MNITMTLMLVGAFTVLPANTSFQIANLADINPVTGLSVSAAGIAFEMNGQGIETHPTETTDFEIELRLKSGTPIRVRL